MRGHTGRKNTNIFGRAAGSSRPGMGERSLVSPLWLALLFATCAQNLWALTSIMRILLLNLGMESTRAVKQALSGQGYEITADRSPTVDEILALSPEVLIAEATPSDLSCCGLISQLKATSDPRTPKVVMIVHGGALERARALDLGTDDVVSFPFEPLELAAKIRTQFRERQPQLELEAKLRDAEQKEHLAKIAVDALHGGTHSKRRYWLALAVLGLSAAAALAALVTVTAAGIRCNSKRNLPG